jgi:hypothetical protein
MDVRYDDRRGIGFGWLVGLALVVWVCVMYLGFGPQAPTSVDDVATRECASAVAPDDIARWIDRLGGWANYENGYWFDASGSVVGRSSAEDSDICSYV